MGDLPPGFRFFPSDEELVVHFLKRKAAVLPCNPDIIPTLDLSLQDPWELNGKALAGGDGWYFFTTMPNRVCSNGYWRIVAEDEAVTSRNKTVGVKKLLSFCIGESPQGKTNWMMHEYHLLDYNVSTSTGNTNRRSSRKRGHNIQESSTWVLCRVFETNCYNDGAELSCLDEVFLSLDDLDEISLPN